MITLVRRKHYYALLIFFILLLTAVFIFPASTYQWSPPCFFKEELHLYCTFCGGFRSVSYLLHGEVLKAWFYNPVVVSAVPFFVFMLLKFVGNTQYKPFAFEIALPKFYVVLFILVLFTVLRNTNYYPYHF